MNSNFSSNSLYSFLVGIFLILFVLFRRWKDSKIFANSIETDGVVVDEELVVGNKGDNFYCAVVRFQLKDSEWITAKTADSYYPKRYLNNNNVKIEYPANDYNKVRIKGSDRTNNLIFLVCGLLLLAYSVYLYLYGSNVPS